MKIIDKNNIPVIGELVLFPGNDNVLLRYSFVKIQCARFKGDKPVNFIDKAVYSGSIIYQIEEALKFIKRNIKTKVEIDELRKKDIYEYPITSIREALVNAVVHRDYQRQGASVRVNIYDNRLEIISPGTLLENVNINDLFETPISELGNRVIGYVFQKLKLIEAWGTGLIRIKEECNKNGIRVAVVEQGGSFIITFYQDVESIGNVGKSVGNMVTYGEKILSLIIRNNKITYKEIVKFLGINEKTVERNIRKLKLKGQIERVGDNRTGYWKVKK